MTPSEPSYSRICTIPLTQGQVALVSEQDYETLKQFKWYANWVPAMNGFYALSTIDGRAIAMHRYILGCGTESVDHKNGDTLDNRRDNLRPCTDTQNQGNRKLNANNTSGFKGVSWLKRKKRWRAAIGKKEIGMFLDKHDAARAYDKAAIEYFGEFARVNFPDSYLR